MNNRRKLIVALGASALTSPFASFAQQQGKPVRVGILASSTQSANQVFENPFVDTMRELGWVEGHNIAYERFYADDDAARLATLAAALAARDLALIYSPNAPPTLAAVAKTRTIPIVFSAVADPVDQGLIKSLAHPGGNVTGVASISWEPGGKRLQLLKQALPKITRVGVLINPSYPNSSRELKLIEQAAATLGVKAIPVVVTQAQELDAAFAALSKNRAEALLTVHVAFFVISVRKRILELAARQRLPVVGPRSEFAEDGALMSYGSILTEQVRRAAHLADKILKGVKPSDIPVEQPTKFELVVNMKTAKSLGIKIPSVIMLQVTRVIE